MQRWGFLEPSPPAAALRWIDAFLDAYGWRIDGIEAARPFVAALRAESCTIPALELERLRSRDVLFFLDAFGQHVDHHEELRGMQVEHDAIEIGAELGLSAQDTLYSLRMALTGESDGPPLDAGRGYGGGGRVARWRSGFHRRPGWLRRTG